MISILFLDIAQAAEDVQQELLTPDEGCHYDRLIEIDLNTVSYVY